MTIEQDKKELAARYIELVKNNNLSKTEACAQIGHHRDSLEKYARQFFPDVDISFRSGPKKSDLFETGTKKVMGRPKGSKKRPETQMITIPFESPKGLSGHQKDAVVQMLKAALSLLES